MALGNMTVDRRWQRRDSNKAADALTNRDFTAFSLETRIVPDLANRKWLVMLGLGAEATGLYGFIAELKALAKANGPVAKVCAFKRKQKS